MTLNEAKAVIYGNVVYACEKAGFPLETTQLVQEACDTIIALANACETIITLADRKTEPQTDYLEYHTDTTHFGKVKGESVTTNKIDDKPQTNYGDYERAIEQIQYNMLYESTYNIEDGTM